ncbi:MAG: HD domain-containing phosphohydrolase [Myxococcota bacterium]
MADRVGINKRVADRLYADGKLAEDHYLQVVDHARRKRMRVEDALVQLGLVPEDVLLKYIATLHKTQFVSTARMAKAKVDREALRVVPKGLAQHFGVYPLVLDRKGDKLIIATADPDDLQALKELQMGAKVKTVAPMVARPEAVVAAIERGYDGDRQRFDDILDREQAEAFEGLFADQTTPRERGRTGASSRDRDDRASAPERAPSAGAPGRPVTGEFAPPRRVTGASARDGGTGGGIARRPPAIDDPWAVRSDIVDEPSHAFDDGYIERDAPPPRARHRLTPQDVPYGYGEVDDVRRERPSTGRRLERGRGAFVGGSAEVDPNRVARQPSLPRRERPPTTQLAEGLVPDLDSKPSFARAAGLNRQAARAPQRRPRPDSVDRVAQAADAASEASAREGVAAPGTSGDGAARSRPRKRRSSLMPRPLGLGPPSSRGGSEHERVSSASLLESLRVLVGLLENERPNTRGHSAVVAQLAANICERVNLTDGETQPVLIASYLHDLGKMGDKHLTALNVAQMDDHFDLATKVYKLPAQLMESVGLPDEVMNIVTRMYERVGGGGIPDGARGSDIPMGARILALADSYADLTRNPANPYDRVLSPEESIDVLRQHAGTVFDQNLVEVLELESGGEKILTDLLANRHRVLVVDPDPEETMVLQLRLVEQGFDVHVARTGPEAREALERTEFALVVSEVDLETQGAGFPLREWVAQHQPGASWVFLSSRKSRDVVERALKLGVDDFQPKPLSHEILVAKLAQIVERKSEHEAPRGVSGSLSQMGIPEIVQILWHGRKTCALNLTAGAKRGQIHFVEGQIVNALWEDVQGETAFYRLLTLGEEGAFAVDPEFQPSERLIQASPEGLLLEGMRLLDEGAVP